MVSEALERGAEPEMLCATCPWDRYCITPPSMTKEQIEAEKAKAAEKDAEDAREKRARGEKPDTGWGAVMTALIFSGKDSQATICPVLSVRLRCQSGEQIVKGLKEQMRSWPADAS